MKQLYLYSPMVVLLTWALCYAIGLSGRALTVLALVMVALSSGAHIREERRRVG